MLSADGWNDGSEKSKWPPKSCSWSCIVVKIRDVCKKGRGLITWSHLHLYLPTSVWVLLSRIVMFLGESKFPHGSNFFLGTKHAPIFSQYKETLILICISVGVGSNVYVYLWSLCINESVSLGIASSAFSSVWWQFYSERTSAFKSSRKLAKTKSLWWEKFGRVWFQMRILLTFKNLQSCKVIRFWAMFILYKILWSFQLVA